MAKVWLQERWGLLISALEDLTVDQEDEIKRICEEEIAYWKARPQMKSASSLKKPMTDTRNALRERLELRENNTWINPKTGNAEHLALKYLNYSEAEWAGMNAQSEDRWQARLEDRKFINRPDLVVAKAVELLKSNRWADISAGLAVATGRRLSEVLAEGEFHPKTNYTVVFGGQLKRQDKILEPYEIPTLCEAQLVLDAIQRLRSLVDCSTIPLDQISVRLGPDVVAAAQRAFEPLVPAREGADLYTHLFRAVYGRIACHYYAKPETSDLTYMAVVYGHYWVVKSTGKQQQNYASTLHYMDYVIGDGAGNIDGRQGIKLSEPGVVVLEVFQTKPVVQKKEKKKVDLLPTIDKKGHSILSPDQKLRARIDDIHEELGNRTINETLSVMVDEHYVLRQMEALLNPMYEQLGVASPVEALQALLGEGMKISVNEHLQENWQTDLDSVQDLLQDASSDTDGPPVVYLKKLLTDKREFKKSYEKRHAGKDYSKMSLTELRKTKTTGAVHERFGRAVVKIMEYNDSVAEPEMRWYISPAVVVDLVGGRPSDAKEYLLTRKDELDAHHNKFEQKITPGYNRRPLPITQRIHMEEVPVGVATESSEEAIVEE
jgi:Telomere resolvase ResT/TelK catalytic domain